MRLAESVEGGIDVLALAGDIDFHYAPVLRTLLQSKIKAKTASLVLDLANVEYIDSTGLAAIIEYFRDAASFAGILCLAGLSPQLKSTFQIVRLDKTIPIFDSRPAALEALQQGAVQPPSETLFARPAA